MMTTIEIYKNKLMELDERKPLELIVPAEKKIKHLEEQLMYANKENNRLRSNVK